MVGFPICYVFAMGIFAAFPSHSRAFSEGSIGGLFYVNFMIDQFSYLNITSIGRNLIQDESDCGYACLEIPRCFSYNVAAFPDVNNKRLCELLPSDKYNNSDKFNTSKEFHHFFIPSSCDNSPCKSTGKCFPSYQENGDKCICVKGFTGKNCETNINDCDYSTCLNNGTCIDQINGFNCSCPSGFAGNRCEIGPWVDYTPQWCGTSYRRQLKWGGGVTLEQCKQLCPGCAAIEYWSAELNGGTKTCWECLDHTKRKSYTNTNDGGYPPHVYIRQ